MHARLFGESWENKFIKAAIATAAHSFLDSVYMIAENFTGSDH